MRVVVVVRGGKLGRRVVLRDVVKFGEMFDYGEIIEY